MTKKITLSLLVLLIVSAFVFVSCDQEAAGTGGGGKPGPAPTKKEPVVNELGTQQKTIIEDVFDDEAPYKIVGDGATLTYAPGKGCDAEGHDSAESDAILVESNYIYGQVALDMTKYYARGKSYYIEAWFKFAGDVEGARTDNACAKLDFSLITGAGYNYEGPDEQGKQHPKHQKWDIPGQYSGDMLSNEKADEIFDIETNLSTQGEDLIDGEWHKVCGILDAEAIETVITTMDELCHATGESTLYEFNIIFLVGTYQEADPETTPNVGQNNYKYYMDNIKIIDLNDDLDREGQTYEEEEDDENNTSGGEVNPEA